MELGDSLYGFRYISESAEQISDLGAKNVVKIPQGTMLISFKLTLGRISFAGCDLYTNEAIASLLNLSNKINKEFLFYYFSLFDWDKAAEGDIKVKGKTLNKKKLNDLKVVIPPLLEQQRIVSILNKCLTAIDKAKANTEQNLKNTKELFESYLQELFKNEKWEKNKIENVCNEIFAGGDAPKNNFSEEPNERHNIPIYANAVKEKGLYGYTDFARVTKPSVTISARGSGTGHTELRTENYLPIVRLIVCIPDTTKITLEFLKLSIDNLEIMRSGSAIPQLTVPMINDYSIPLPPLHVQQSIVLQLDSLKAQTQKLETVYNKKISDLEELKSSILQEAFRGQI